MEKWHTPIALCIRDDCSRLCCHIQWYYQEAAEILQHGLLQAFMKRGLSRSLMTDNGAAMIAHETTNGLLGLSIKHDRTLPYSPHQNGTQESFWGQLEGPDSSRPAPDNEKMIFAFAIGEVVPSEKVEGLFKSKAFALKFHPVSVISIDCTYDIKAGISARPGR
jgi:transposase InsO family protein